MSEVSNDTYFHQLPCDAIEVIIRNLSSRPRHVNYVAYIDPTTGAETLSKHSPLRPVARKLLNSVSITPNLSRATNSLYFLSIEDMFTLNWCIRYAAGDVNHILIRYGSARLPTPWIRDLARNCIMLRKLEIHEDVGDEGLERIFRARGPALISLTIWHLYSRERIELVSRNCTGLEELGVRHLLCESETLWRKVGPNLISLHVLLCGINYPAGRLDPSVTLHGIRTYCRKLTSLYIEDPFETYDLAVAALYASYGGQLKNINVQQLAPSACSVVAAACSSLMLSLGHRDSIVAQCRILGPLAKSISFECEAPEAEPLSEALEPCKDITQIGPAYLRNWAPDQVSALSSAPFAALEVFQMADAFTSPGSEAALMTILSNETGSLRELEIAVQVDRPCDFLDIAKRNPKIRRVSIKLAALEENEQLEARVETVVHHIVKTFVGSKNLLELTILHAGGVIRNCVVLSSKIDAVADACVPYRTRPTYLKVGSIAYLP